ncbi:MAG TPA: sulfotransferase [Caulobacteraceae bacterium]|nr:sulfotransferase [Caulobacteraceae bacterium]
MAGSATLKDALGALASDPARSEALARALLRDFPDSPDVQTVLGSALRAQGKLEAAAAVLAPLAASHATPWPALYEWARLLVDLGRSREAAAPLARAAALNPDLAGAWRLLGDIRLVGGDFQSAQGAYDRMLCAALPEARLRGPAEALAEGRLDAAEQDLRAMLERDPASMTAAHLMGEVLARQGRLDAALAVLSFCLERAPGLALARQAHALALHRAGRHGEALAQLDRLAARGQLDNRCHMTRAALLAEMGDYAGAAEITAAVLESFPDQPQAWLLHGHGLRTLGRRDEAVAAYERCLALDAAVAEAWWSLANLKAHRFSAEARAAMAARLAGELGPADRGHLHFALGKASEDAGRHGEAFEHYRSGNALVRAGRAYDPDATSAFVARCKALFTPAFFAEREGWGFEAADPIFIVGLPRSGSTLVDQILASHGEVEGVQELMDVQAMADAVGRLPGVYPDQLAALGPQDFARLGRDYLERTRPRRRLGRPRFTDKAPWNVLHVGLIHLMLPNARIIDVRRHPLACCLSAYRQHFAGGFDFAYDLTDLGRYYADYVDLMAHVDQVLPGRVCRIFYEALVADPQREVRRLSAHLGLAFDPASLRFFENPRPVATPSSEQVRQPIFTSGLDDWRRFEPWLGPLKAALGPTLGAYPSPPRAS